MTQASSNSRNGVFGAMFVGVRTLTNNDSGEFHCTSTVTKLDSISDIRVTLVLTFVWHSNIIVGNEKVPQVNDCASPGLIKLYCLYQQDDKILQSAVRL